MKRSTEGILTTHTGSLARPPALLALLQAKVSGQPYDAAAFESTARAAIAESVRDQVESGIDVVSDGELSKPQFSDYVADRLSGFEGHNPSPGFVRPSRRPEPFPAYAAATAAPIATDISATRRPMCVAPLAWNDRAYETDIANLKDALAAAPATEAFLRHRHPASLRCVSPTSTTRPRRLISSPSPT